MRTWSYTKEISVDKHAMQTEKLRSDIWYEERALQRQRNAYRNIKLKIGRLRKTRPHPDTISDRSWPYLKLAGGNKRLARHIELELGDELRRMDHEILRHEERLRDKLAEYDDSLGHLQRLKLQLASQLSDENQGPNVISVKDVEQQLARDNCYYRAGSLKFKTHQFDSRRAIATVVFNSTRAVDIHADDEDWEARPSIVIYPVTVDFHMNFRHNTFSTSIRAVPNESFRVLGFDDQRVLHPHMTAPTQPCLGDYAAPIQEALENMDIPTAASVMLMFLQRFDPDDGAGRHYYKFDKYPEPTDIAA
mgnify:CR=1 FL=1